MLGGEFINYLNKFTIKQRIFAMFVFSIVFLTGFSVLSVIGMNQMGGMVNTMYEHPLVVSNAALDANNGIAKIQRTLFGLLLTKDSTKRQLSILEISNLEVAIYNNMDIAKNTILFDAGKALEHQARLILDSYRDSNNHAIALITTGQEEAATKIILGENQLIFSKLDQKIEELRTYAKNRASIYVDNANGIKKNFSIALILTSIIICILMFTIFIVTLKSILASLHILKQAMSDSTTSNNLLGVDLEGNNEIVDMSKDYNMLIKIVNNQFWIKDGLTKLNLELIGVVNFDELTVKLITFLSRYLNCGNGALYIFDNEEKVLKLHGSYAFTETDKAVDKYSLGNGIVGQVAYEQKSILLSNININDESIAAGLMNKSSVNIFAFPLVYEDELQGVIKLSSFQSFDKLQQDFLNEAGKIIAINLSSEIQDEQIRKLLKDTQLTNVKMEEQHERLQQQSAELQQTNTQLEEQKQILLQQSEELLQTNSQLEEQHQMLQEQSENLFEKNESLIDTRDKLDQRAKQLETASNYKSQFLANMSHELRTPLNSIILLSKLLTNNVNNSLVEKDIEKSEIINRSGNELLRLINDVLDLSKIEAGKVELNITTFPTKELVVGLKEIFELEATEKGIDFILEDHLNSTITTDKDKLSQIIRNFISNAIKFTKNGTVKLLIKNSGEKEKPVLISVSDTGIGISKNQQDVIFNAFEQADNSISRKYGGTGLGLFISKDISYHLKGEIRIKSKEGVGSEFSLYLPSKLTYEMISTDVKNTENKALKDEIAITNEKIPESVLHDDRNSINVNDKVLLIIKDDYEFSLLVMNSNKGLGIKSLLATTGQEGLKLAKEYKVDGVFLELDLPDINGLEVLREFKCTRELSEIPVCIVSDWEDDYKTQTMGVVGYIKKTVKSEELTNLIQRMIFNIKEVTKTMSSGTILLIDNNEKQRKDLHKQLETRKLKIIAVASEEEGIEKLKNDAVKVVILGFESENADGTKLCKYIIDNSLNIPTIGYTSGQLTGSQEKELRNRFDRFIINTDNSIERLLDEVEVFMKQDKKLIIKEENLDDKIKKMYIDRLEGKKILIVDDDSKNIYVLTAALEEFGVDIIDAENGVIALEKLQNNEIDLVLMDIMMPVMDGLECIKVIRNSEKLKAIPIIALTAKALKGDKEKCLAAGANDYITKPLDYDVLITLIKAWITKKV